MKTIVGLGNPGEKCRSTRHNVGFLFVDYLRNKLHTPHFKFQTKHNAEITSDSEITLIKPQTFMNQSGIAVQSYLKYYNKQWQDHLNTLFVAHDDLDLTFGTYKIQLAKGPKVHNGLLSLYDHLHSNNFWHIRIGVDGRAGERTQPGSEYVLANFSQTELTQLETIFSDIYDSVLKTI